MARATGPDPADGLGWADGRRLSIGGRTGVLGGGLYRCRGWRAWAGRPGRAPRSSASLRPQRPGRSGTGAPETRLNFYYPPTCVRLVDSPSYACPHPAGACIVLPRAAPRSAAARTPRTGYCGRRRRSDRPFRTGLQRWLEEEEILPQAPVFHEFLESIIFFNF